MSHDIKIFLDSIRYYISLTDELESDIRDRVSITSFKKNETLFEQGYVARHIYFIMRGTCRTYYFDKGKDITSWIYPEGIIFTSWHSFLAQKPSFEFAEVLEDSLILQLSYMDLQWLYKKYHVMERWGRLIAEEQLGFIDEYSKSYMFLSAKEKYDLLHSFFPDVTQRVNLGHIASLLGISQETLSRIRSSK